MGRINLAALQVRKRAVFKYKASLGKGLEKGVIPNWIDIVADVPPTQILTRHQPIRHAVQQIRTRTLPESSKAQQFATTISPTRRLKPGKQASKLFRPVEIRYEEDDLRRPFFSDHPGELARPRIVVETTGEQYQNADWSKGLQQRGIPLSGESVVQRQLWLLQNVPDITIEQSYEIARKEFYMLRRAEETQRRIAIEEAEHGGARFGKKALVWGMEEENKMYDNWEAWSRAQTIENMQRLSAIAGEALPVEQEAVAGTAEFEGPGESSSSISKPKRARGTDPFSGAAQRKGQYNVA